MTTNSTSYPDISAALLNKLAGSRAYERGVDYFRNGHVEELTIDEEKIWAEVSGTEDYRVDLVYNQRGLTGACNCPASEGIGFCKHCVAASLALKAELQAQAKQKQAGKPRKTSAKPSEVITAWLKQQSKDEVIRHFVTVVPQDRTLKNEWLLKAEKGLGRLDKAAIKKQLEAAYPVNKEIHEYPKVRAYFAAANTIIEELEQPIRQMSVQTQLELVEYGLDRLGEALETIDDSDGFRYDSQMILQELMVDIVPQLEWPAEQVASYLLDKHLVDDCDFYGDIPGDYEEFLSIECIDAFYKKAQVLWDDLPPPSQQSAKEKHSQRCLEWLLGQRAREVGNQQTLIAIKEKAATSGHDFVQLAELYLEQQDFEQAQKWLNKAKKWDSHNRGIGHDVQLQLYLASGQGNEAVLCQWRYFQDHTSIENYHRLLSLAEQVGNKTDWPAQVIAWLEDNLESERENTWKGWHDLHRANTLLQLYLNDKAFDKAWRVVGRTVVSSELEMDLAVASAQYSLEVYWEKVVSVYKKQIIANIKKGENRAYQRAVELLIELHGLAKDDPFFSQVALMIATLRATHKRKRNFIRFLNEALTIGSHV